MLDFGDLEKRLNADPNTRKAFFKDPVGFFAKEGIKLSKKQANRLRMVTKLKAKGRPMAAQEYELDIRANEAD
jgi:hypothetical protein